MLHQKTEGASTHGDHNEASRTLEKSGQSHHDHRRLEELDPRNMVGATLVLGFLFMLLVDQLVSRHRRPKTLPTAVAGTCYGKFLSHHCLTCFIIPQHIASWELNALCHRFKVPMHES